MNLIRVMVRDAWDTGTKREGTKYMEAASRFEGPGP